MSGCGVMAIFSIFVMLPWNPILRRRETKIKSKNFAGKLNWQFNHNF